MPEFNINIIAVLVAVVANFFLGFVWYTFLFGKTWAKEMGMDMDQKPDKAVMARGMVFMILGNFFMAWVFAHNIAAWDPTTWGLPPSEVPAASNALMAAFFTWLGFFFPVDIGVVAWENKSWKLFAINTVYHFLMLLVAAMILVHM